MPGPSCDQVDTARDLEIDGGLRNGEDDYEQRLRALRSQRVSGPPAGGR
jgi:hypothetical protein